MKRKDLARRAASAAMAACMMFTLSAPALAESTDALMQLSIGSYRSSSLLSEENSVTLPDITVGSTKVTEDNYQNILGDNTLSYDTNTNTLKSTGCINRGLTIDAPNVDVVLEGNADDRYCTVNGSLTIKNAHDVTVSCKKYVAISGNAQINCTGKLTINAPDSAVKEKLTVVNAGEIEINANGSNIARRGIDIQNCVGTVTLRNADGKIAPDNINDPFKYTRTDGASYSYYLAEDGEAFDPKADPIVNHLTSSYLRIEPVTLHALTVKNGTVPGGTITTDPKNNQTTTSAMVAKGDVVEIEGKNFNNAKKAFDQWKVESGNAEIPNPYQEKTTLHVTGEGDVTVKASYMTPRTVTVTDGNGTVKGLTPHGTKNIFVGDTVEVTAKELSGKQFDHWECAPELTDTSDNPLTEDAKKNRTVTFKMPQGDVTLTAVYKEAKSFTLKHGTILSVTRGGASVPVTDSMELFAGDTVTITPNNRLSEKRLFDHWEIKSDNVTLSGPKTATFTMPDAPVELEAVYNNLYTVTVDDGTNTRTNNHIAGDIVTVKANVPAGEKFTGWKVENNTALSLNGQSIDLTQREITFNMPSTNITLTAEHKTIHTLTVVGGTIDGSTTGNTIQAIAGDTITVHSALAADQQFLHWKSEGMGLTDSQSKNDPLTIKMPDGDVTITAVPKQLYTVTVVNGKVHDKSADTANPGDTVTIKAADRTALGEVFVGWTVTTTDVNGQPNVKLDNPTAAITTFTMVGANVKVEANYEKQHTVTVLYQTETSTTEDISQKQTAIYGDNIAVTAEDKTADDLIFDHWEVKVDGLDVPGLFADYEKADASFKMRRADVTLTAVYKKLYTITITNNVNNDVDSTRKTKVGGTVPLEAAPIPGYRFKSWNVISHNATVTDTGLTLNGAGNVQVKAEYVKLYDLTVNYGTAVNKTVETETTTDGDGRIVLPAADGDSITATANGTTPDQIFTGWTSNVTLTKDNVALTEDELKNPDITFDMPAGAVTLTATYSYVHDQTVKVTNGTARTGSAAGEEIIATPGETVYIEPADRWEENLIFTEWKVTGGKGVSLEYDENGTHFVMPQSDVPVEITAQYAKLNAVTIIDGDVIDADGHGINDMNDGKPGAIAGTNITIKAKDKSDEGKVFDYWEVTSNNVSLNDDGSFEMPDEAVVITARYANVHDVTVHSDDLSYSKTFEDIKVGTPYEVTAPEIPGKRFSHWFVNLGDVTDLVTDLAERTGTFTMPDGNVDLTAEYVKLYGLTVTYGTAADANGKPAPSAAKGDRITVTADEPTMETFEGWKLLEGTITEITDKDGNVLNVSVNEDGYLVDENGEKILNTPFTFTMPDGNVELKADYSMPAYVMEQPVTVEGGTAFAEGEAAAAEIVVDPGKRITVIADPNTDSNMIFDYWEVTSLDEDGKATVKLEDATSMTTSFTMPMAPVELTAHWRTIDEAPSGGGDGGAGAAIAGVAIGGAAVWGGYEITTRVILNDLLPEGAAIPANRGELAMLVWQTAGKPEPAAQPAFTDVADAELAKAAQWCVEQGLLDAKDGKFDPNGWMPKYKTIEVWKKAFPKQ